MSMGTEHVNVSFRRLSKIIQTEIESNGLKRFRIHEGELALFHRASNRLTVYSLLDQPSDIGDAEAYNVLLEEIAGNRGKPVNIPIGSRSMAKSQPQSQPYGVNPKGRRSGRRWASYEHGQRKLERIMERARRRANG